MEPPEPFLLYTLFSTLLVVSITTWIYALVLLVLLFMSALISGSEVAYFSISPKQLDGLKSSSERVDEQVVSLIDKPKKLLATILVANNFINIAIVTVSTFLLSDLLSDVGWSDLVMFIIEIGLVTFIILLFGEVLPKVYATNYNLKFAKFMVIPILILAKVFYPIILLLLSSGSITDKLVKKKPNDIGVSELGHALELTMSNADADEQKILEGIVNFGNINVKQIMTPRTATTAFDSEMNFAALLDNFVESGHSRVPIFKKSFDEIVGILYLKDFIRHIGKTEFNWQELIREAFYVPENKMIDDLLKDFQERKMHLAIVVDEYGGTSGIVTLEDVIEEIVGEITDEFDDENLHYSKLDDNNYSFEGSTPLVDVYRIMDIEGAEFEKVKGEADTLAGFVVELSEKIPLKNERITFQQYTFTIEAADKRRVKQVKITRNGNTEA